MAFNFVNRQGHPSEVAKKAQVSQQVVGEVFRALAERLGMRQDREKIQVRGDAGIPALVR
jgi:hypothetical protein